MRSTQVITVLALLASSVSSMSIGSPNQLAHRRHASSVTHDSVLQARGARKYVPEQDITKREETAPHWGRKRGINQRRCAAKSSSASSALAASTSSAAATSTPEPEPTTSSAEPTASAAAKYTKSVKAETTTKPETTPKAENTKTSTKATKTSTAAAAATSSSSSSSSSSTNTGEGTFYATGLGACGITNVDTDYICAVSQSLFDGFDGYTGSDPNSNPICGKKIKATYEGKSVTVTVTDRCVGCAYNDLDFSPSAFDQLADESVGRLKGMTWVWIS